MKKVICVTAFMLIMCMMFSAASVSAVVSDDYLYVLNIMKNVDSSYKEEIMPHFYPEKYNGREDMWVYYNMLYAHNADTLSEPEYIVFIGLSGIGEPAFVTEYFGDYTVTMSSMDYPYDLGFYVYVPAEQKVYTLREAWDSEALNITAAFESGRIGLYKYDLNMDSKFDIMDATYIQMCIAGFDGYELNGRMDVDKDGKKTIMDATAIQRHIAGLE